MRSGIPGRRAHTIFGLFAAVAQFSTNPATNTLGAAKIDILQAVILNRDLSMLAAVQYDVIDGDLHIEYESWVRGGAPQAFGGQSANVSWISFR